LSWDSCVRQEYCSSLSRRLRVRLRDEAEGLCGRGNLPEINQWLNLALGCALLPYSRLGKENFVRESGQLQFLLGEVEIFRRDLGL
jgi:hypothetical protein